MSRRQTQPSTSPCPDQRGGDRLGERMGERVGERVDDVVAAVKPHLRGWLHAGVFPLVVAAGIVLVALAPTTAGRVSSAVFAITAALLFGTSAVYHRGSWSPRTKMLLKRF